MVETVVYGSQEVSQALYIWVPGGVPGTVHMGVPDWCPRTVYLRSILVSKNGVSEVRTVPIRVKQCQNSANKGQTVSKQCQNSVK